ncbi:MAG TPA: hypothetical protein VMU50_21810 [Polyangia bacterium]|nr:hypothetical protein [Polyangia bacterium]
MKLYLHSGDADEIRHEQRRGVMSGVTVDESGRAGQGIERRLDWLAAIAAAAHGPTCVTVETAEPEGMVREAVALAGLGANVVVGLPPTPGGLQAIAACAPRGIRIQLRGYRSMTDIELGARAGAQWFTPALDAAASAFDVAEMVRVAVGALRTYARSAPVLAGPLQTREQAVEAGLAGAEVASVGLALLQGVRGSAPPL